MRSYCRRPMIPNWLQGISLSSAFVTAFASLPAGQLIAQEASPAAMAAAISAAQAQGVSAEAIQQLQNTSNGNIGNSAKTAPKSAIPAFQGGTSNRTLLPGFSAHLSPFGEELFSRNQGRYISPSDLPVPADYIVGIGDTVEIRYFGKENRVMRLPVERDGSITIPEIGAVSVAGLTLENMGAMLLERISKQKIGVDATVSMGPLRSIQIFLMGDVNIPGAVTTDALTTVSNALMFGGGIKPSGSMRRIEIRRQGKTVSRIDLYDSLLKGSDLGELRLQSGDVVFVPTVGKRAAVDGEVQRPAIYELLHEKTVGDLIRLAGGMKPSAYARSSRLNRIGTGWERSTSLVSLVTPGEQKMPLHDGDIIEIPGVMQTQTPSQVDFRFPTVTLEGQFLASGTYAWQEGTHLGQLVPRFEQLSLDAYRPLAVIDRLDPLTGSRYYKTINLIDVVARKITVPLQRDDRVFTLSQHDVEFLSSVKVQQVLAGKMPPVNNGASAVVIDAAAAAADKQALEASRKAFDVGGRDIKRSGDVVASSDTCRGLVELAHIIANEGSDRFRSAVFAGAYAEDGQQMVKSVPCPALFENNPRMLPFLLENAITLRGEIKDPGVLPIAEGMSLDVALRSRGGLTRSADLSGIEINKLVAGATGTQVVRERLASNAALSEIALEPGYIVQVRKRATEQDRGLVRISGEAAHPGAYEIRKGEKLSELLARAGGLTQFAYPQGSIFLRPSVKEEKRQYYAKAANDIMQHALFQLSRERADGQSGGDTNAILQIAQQVKATNPIGRMVIESDPNVLQVRPELDVMLQPGDEIHIPRRPSTILVMGEVLNPGAVQFVAGKKADQYIREAGGLNQFADQDYIIAVYPNGQAEPIKLSSWNFTPTLLPPGSAIYVSREPITTTGLDILKLTLQIAKDLALTAASISVIGNN